MQTDRAGRPLLALLALLLAFASLSTDLYLPAMPEMAEDLGASHGALELSVSGFLLGFAIGQLFWGPLSDRIGRRLPLAAGIALFILGSAGCALAGDIQQLIGSRLVQALGASASVVIARAIVSDLFDRERAARVLSILTAIMVIAPMIGPSVGAQILHLGSWRTIFWVLVALGGGTLAMLWTIVPETLPPGRRPHSTLAAIGTNYAALIRDRRFLSYALVCAFISAGLFAYVAGSSFAFIDRYDLSPQIFAGIFAVNSLGIISINLVNARLIPRLGSDRLLRIGVLLAATSGGFVFVAALGMGGAPSLAVALFCFAASSGLIMANAISGGMVASPVGAGAASAVLGFMQYGGGFLGATLLGSLANGTLIPLGAVMLAGGLGGLLTIIWGSSGPMVVDDVRA